jgi:hypothetical protein
VLANRLIQFEPNQHENNASKRIYLLWHEAYKTGEASLKRFDAIYQNIKAGNVNEATTALNIPPGVLPDGLQKCFLYMVLMNEEPPMMHFWQKIQVINRQLLNDLLSIARSNGTDKEVCEEVELIASWIVSFPHPEDEPDAPNEKPFFTGFIETAAKFLTGFAVGRLTATREE